MTRITKRDDGKYHIGNQVYDLLEGSRAQVWHRTAYRTSGGLRRKDLMQNDQGRIVSKVKSQLGKSQKHLGSHLQKKGSGKFGPNKNKTVKNRGMKKGGKTAKKGGKSRKH